MANHLICMPFMYITRLETYHNTIVQNDIDSLVQDCSNSIANALELPQSYTKPLMT